MGRGRRETSSAESDNALYRRLGQVSTEKVVEVLEAVQLLLAFELFVVVVAVDTRWLTSSLESGLTSLQPSHTSADSPTEVDCIEKIFQIPFCVEQWGGRLPSRRYLAERGRRSRRSGCRAGRRASGDA